MAGLSIWSPPMMRRLRGYLIVFSILFSRHPALGDEPHDFGGGGGDVGAGAEHGGNPFGAQARMIRGRDDAAADHQNTIVAGRPEAGDQVGHQAAMGAGLA